MVHLYAYGDKAEHVCTWPMFKRDELVFGVELEVEPRSNASQSMLLTLLPYRPNYFCKEDGSLNAGVEIVTVPLTLDQHRAEFDWPGLLAPLLSCAMSGSRTQRCGMHIHINRRALSALTLAKLYLFLNDPNNLRFMETVAQRSNSRWAIMEKKTWGDCTEYDGYANAGRYQALNLTRTTAELRLFRGTIRHERVIKNIEAAHAMVTWCRENSAAQVSNWKDFVRFVTARDEWPTLAAFLSEVGVTA